MKQEHKNLSSQRGGFTLVEMLISVGLVLLMMTLFAQIFSMATESVQSQQANGESDQRVRTLSTIIRADFAKRTMRRVQPYFPGETRTDSPTSFADRGGYFYLSTNNPASGLDDVLQFTVSSEIVNENRDTTPFFGRGRQLVHRPAGSINDALVANVNQPELDDGNLTADATSQSTAAQVCYFIRNGNLYRRVLMLRDPLNVSGATLEAQPRSLSGRDFFAGYTDDMDPEGTFDGGFLIQPSNLTDDFLQHFDFSAVAKEQTLGSTVVRTAGLQGRDALSNDPGDGSQFPLGVPHFRFGFHQSSGLSHEFLNADADSPFHGRYLHAETSSANFNWPQRPSTVEGGAAVLWSDPAFAVGGDPYATVPRSVHPYSFNNLGLINDFDSATANGRGGSRAVEDLLLSNVHEFRVELWDEQLQAYVPPGYTGTTIEGSLHRNRRLTARSGPGGVHVRNVFDTWHPDIAFHDASFNDEFPPYLPHVFTPPTFPGPVVAENLGWYLVDGSNEYSVGDIVFPFRDDPNGVGGGTAGTFEAMIDEAALAGFQRAYRCIDVAGTATSGLPAGALLGRPSTTIGQRITDGQVQWEVIDNTQPITSARIRIRFVNSRSEKIRQLTLILPLSSGT